MRAPFVAALGLRLDIADHSRAICIRACGEAERDCEQPHQPHPASIVAISTRPVLIDTGPPSIASAAACSVRGRSVRSHSTLSGTAIEHPLKIIITVASANVRIVYPFMRVERVLRVL